MTRRSGMKACGFFAAVLGWAPVGGGAQGSGEGEEVLEEVVVTAERERVLRKDFAGSATVIDRKEIEESGARSVADLLAAKGGVRISSVTGDASGGAIHLRGFGENSSSRALILVDGRPLNRPDMAAVSLLELPVGRIARVEILRGSQTARFGDNAVGGVIHVVTKSPPARPEGFFEGMGGSDGFSLFRGGYGGVFGGNGLRMDVERSFSDGWRENSGREAESASLRWERNAGRAEFDAGISWVEERVEFPGPLTTEAYRADPRQTLYDDPGQYFSEQTRWRADGSMRVRISDGWNVDVPVSWSQRDQSWNFGAGSHTDHLLETFTTAPVLRFSRGRWSAEGGFGYRRDALDLVQYAEIERRNVTSVADLEREVYGGFSSVGWEPWDGWHFSVAGRLERSEVRARAANRMFWWDPDLNFSRHGDELNHALQVGVKWEGRKGQAAWLRYDRLYRWPSTDEVASYQGYPMKVPFNDRLEAETGHQIELGGEVAWGGWNFRLNGFVQRLDGEIAYDYVENLNLNFADTERYGVESEAGYRTEGWEFKLWHHWLMARYRNGVYEGNDVYLVPRHEAGGVVTWRPAEWLEWQAEYLFTGHAYEGNDFENSQDRLPSYGVANLMVRWKPVEGLMCYARVNNVFDERYATVKYGGVWYPAAGRQFQIGMRKEF